MSSLLPTHAGAQSSQSLTPASLSRNSYNGRTVANPNRDVDDGNESLMMAQRIVILTSLLFVALAVTLQMAALFNPAAAPFVLSTFIVRTLLAGQLGMAASSTYVLSICFRDDSKEKQWLCDLMNVASATTATASLPIIGISLTLTQFAIVSVCTSLCIIYRQRTA